VPTPRKNREPLTALSESLAVSSAQQSDEAAPCVAPKECVVATPPLVVEAHGAHYLALIA